MNMRNIQELNAVALKMYFLENAIDWVQGCNNSFKKNECKLILFIRYSKSLNLELRVREGGIKYSCKIGLSQFSQASKCDDKRRTCIVEKRLYFQIKGTFLE